MLVITDIIRDISIVSQTGQRYHGVAAAGKDHVSLLYVLCILSSVKLIFVIDKEMSCVQIVRTLCFRDLNRDPAVHGIIVQMPLDSEKEVQSLITTIHFLSLSIIKVLAGKQ